jgi:benzodiazapine receptor
MIKSWMAIGAVTLLVALGGGLITPNDARWFKRLQRPRWLTFEVAIPFIWTVVFICGAWSAYVVWERQKSWWLMGFYLLVELVTIAYNPAMFRLRSLKIGTILGGIGAVLGIILAVVVTTTLCNLESHRYLHDLGNDETKSRCCLGRFRRQKATHA